MSDAIDKVRFPKLTGTENWDDWKQYAESYLMMKIKSDVLGSDYPKSTDEYYAQFVADDRVAQGFLRMAVDIEITRVIAGFSSAKRMWAYLEEQYGDYATAKEIKLFGMFVNLKKTPEETLRQYLCRADSIVQGLKEVNAAPKDIHYWWVVTNGIKDEYPLVASNLMLKLTKNKDQSLLTKTSIRSFLEPSCSWADSRAQG